MQMNSIYLILDMQNDLVNAGAKIETSTIVSFG